MMKFKAIFSSCTACEYFAPHWNKVGERLKGIAKVADINCDKSYDYCDDVVDCTQYPGTT